MKKAPHPTDTGREVTIHKPGPTARTEFSDFLLPSRLYCRLRNFTESCGSPNHSLRRRTIEENARGLYRRWGIAPRPEELLHAHYNHLSVKSKGRIARIFRPKTGNGRQRIPVRTTSPLRPAPPARLVALAYQLTSGLCSILTIPAAHVPNGFAR